jgi:hypothetical protein
MPDCRARIIGHAKHARAVMILNFGNATGGLRRSTAS